MSKNTETNNKETKPNTTTEPSKPTNLSNEDLYLNSKKDFRPNRYEDYGYFFFPMRFGNVRTPQWYEKFFSYSSSRELLNKNVCEENVEKCLKKHPGVKLLVTAMKTVGCNVDLMRHFSCEFCDEAVKGGFDPSTNQSIMCYNTIDNHQKEELANELIRSLLQGYDYCRANYNMFDLRHLACTQVCSKFKFISKLKIILCHNQVYEYNDCAEILSHELIHAYDYCRANLDINNNYHIACSEIRAANLTSCSILSSVEMDSTSLLKIKNTQRECVRRKAALSLQIVRNITESEAFKVVDSVFEKCYNDREPFGRRVLTEEDCQRAYKDRKKFGYD